MTGCCIQSMRSNSGLPYLASPLQPAAARASSVVGVACKTVTPWPLQAHNPEESGLDRYCLIRGTPVRDTRRI
jgi:hypothetical protein